jgi:hypothetical protein
MAGRDLGNFREALRLVITECPGGAEEALLHAPMSGYLSDEEFDRCLRALVYQGAIRRERGYCFPAGERT